MRNNKFMKILTAVCAAAFISNASPNIMRGINYLHNTKTDFSSKESDKSLRHLDWGVGVDWVSLVNVHEQETERSTEIYNTEKTADWKSLEHVVKECKRRKINVMLKPHVDCKNDVSRCEIYFNNRKDWNAWFESYTSLIVEYAKFAEKNDVEMLSVGCELDGTVKTRPWKEIVDTVKSHYGGKLVYCSLFPEKIRFWEELDYVGVNLYPKVKIDSIDQFRLALEESGHVERLREISDKQDRKIIITEWGYQNKKGTLENPIYWGDTHSKDSSLAEQEIGYKEYIDYFFNKPNRDFIVGSFVWAWRFENLNGNRTYCPKGKPAEKVLRRFYRFDR